MTSATLTAKFDEKTAEISTLFDIPQPKGTNDANITAGASIYTQNSSQGSSQGLIGTSQRFLDTEATTLFWNTLQAKITTMTSEADSKLMDKKYALEQAHAAVTNLRDTVNRHEVGIENKGKEMSRLQDDIDSARNEVRGLMSLQDRLKKAEEACTIAKNKLRDFIEPSDAGASSAMFAMSALSQTGVALTGDALQPGYDEQGNYLGYAAMKADIQKRFSEAKTCVQMLSDEYERDAIHLLQLSSKRKDLDMKQAAVKQVEADIHDERAKLTSLWSRTRSILEKYLTQSPSDATLQNEISQLEVPVELESLNAIMGTLERTLLKIARESETANKTQNSVAQDVSSAEGCLVPKQVQYR